MDYSVNFPVNFESGGDTVSEAFGKHIEEFKNVYNILAAFGRQNDSQDLDIQNLKTCDINGNRIIGSIDGSRISGNIDGNKIAGNVDGSKVTGALPNATISYGKVIGLDEHVQTLIPDIDKQVEEISAGESGYVKFGAGLIIQWGSFIINDAQSTPTVKGNFPTSFKHGCYSLTATVKKDIISTGGFEKIQLLKYEPRGDGNYYPVDYKTSYCFYVGGNGEIQVYYMAIGA